MFNFETDHGFTASLGDQLWEEQNIFNLEANLREDIVINGKHPTIGFEEIMWAVINVRKVGSVSINGLYIKANG